MIYIVGAERLGLPSKPRWGERSGIVQTRLQYDLDPNVPTATCHLQSAEDQAALCGFPWEGLTAVPGFPTWQDIDPIWRCGQCDTLNGEDP